MGAAPSINVSEDVVEVDGNEYDRGIAEAGFSVLTNTRSDVNTREGLIQRMGQQYDGERDVHEVLGYPDEIESEDYRAKYERLDVATRIVELPADDTWRKAPRVYDDDADGDDFQSDINKIDQTNRLFHYLRRLDIVSGIGEYGLLLIGLKDNQPLESEPVESNIDSPDDVAFFTPFAQDHVEDWKLGKHVENSGHNEPGDPRYNKPVQYQIDFNAYIDDEDIPDSTQEGGEEEDLQWVHWKRIIHVAEGKTENDLRGTPRQKPVYNRLIDYEKVIGASAEMFWTGAAPRFHFDVNTEDSSSIPSEELDNLDGEVRKFVNEMQTYLKTFNTDVEVIGGEEVDPTGVLDNLYAAFSGQTGIPQRILKGSERGELASSQDRANWFDRIRTRQHRFAEPDILRKVIDRLYTLGAIEEPRNETYTVDWPNLFELNTLEETEVKQNRAQTAQTMAPRNNTARLPGPYSDWLEYVETGEMSDAIKESEPQMSMNARIEPGDKVLVDGKRAVVQEKKTTEFETHTKDNMDASASNPVFVIVSVEGLEYVTRDQITSEEWRIDRDGKRDLEESQNLATNEVFNWPDSWKKSSTPARLIALDAWASMGAQFNCNSGQCCTGTMKGKVRDPEGFCASFKDRIFGTELWRGRF